jgi:CBS domain-containing protein
MGKLLPNFGNATYSGAGELSPLMNDPDYETIGVGTHIFLGGGDGIITAEGTQHSPKNLNGTLFVQGDLKKMSPEYFAGASMKVYGTSAFVGMGIPIPILNARMAKKCAITDAEIFSSVTDYSTGRRGRPVLKQATYAELKTGKLELNGNEIRVSSLSSLNKARKIANELKGRIKKGEFFLYKPVRQLATDTVFKPMREAHAVEFVKNFKKVAQTVLIDTNIKDVAQLVIKNNDNHIIVTDNQGNLEGFVTTFDITKSVAGKGNTIRDIMIPKDKVQTVRDTDPTDVAIRRMQQYKISSLPVVDEKGKVLGIITAEELIRARDQQRTEA